VKLCENCKYKAPPPPELAPLHEEMRKYFPKVFYCKLLNAVRCYNPNRPTQVFDCDFYEAIEASQ